jgi:hypothetical protein
MRRSAVMSWMRRRWWGADPVGRRYLSEGSMAKLTQTGMMTADQRR